MSLVDDLLIILTHYQSSYKPLREKLASYSDPGPLSRKSYREIKDPVLRVTLSRLKKQGLVENKNKTWKITKRGRRYINIKMSSNVSWLVHDHKTDQEKNLIIIFDVPEIERSKRDRLRLALKTLGFVPIQKSVWMGPSPLPKKFLGYLSKIKVLPYLKFFKALEKDIV